MALDALNVFPQQNGSATIFIASDGAEDEVVLTASDDATIEVKAILGYCDGDVSFTIDGDTVVQVSTGNWGYRSGEKDCLFEVPLGENLVVTTEATFAFTLVTKQR